MKTGLLEVMEQVTIYFKENLPKYICCLDMLEPEAEKSEPWALWLTEQRRLRKGNGRVLLQWRFWIKCKKVCKKICKKVQE